MPALKIRPIPELSQEKIEEFWSKVDVRGPNECWPWLGAEQKGYGFFETVKASRLKPHLRKKRLSHRVSWMLHNGYDSPLPICHSCDWPPCNNPFHLFEGTLDDNNKDRHRKGRTVVPRIHGSNHWRSELDELKVRAIRTRHSNGEKAKDLAIEYKVSRGTILNAVNRVSWTHVD